MEGDTSIPEEPAHDPSAGDTRSEVHEDWHAGGPPAGEAPSQPDPDRLHATGEHPLVGLSGVEEHKVGTQRSGHESAAATEDDQEGEDNYPDMRDHNR